MVYEPREDSFLLKKHIAEYASGVVLDIGTGSGILAKEAQKTAETVFAVDIDQEAVSYAEKALEGTDINVAKSDLFSYFSEKGIKFDLVIFNPPYLPDDERVKDIALDGGKKGYELIQRFLCSLSDYLKDDGKALILFSSLTGKNKIDEIIMKNALRAKELDSESLQFEKLYVYLIEKSSFLKEAHENGIKNIKYFTKGKRGIIFRGELEHLSVAIKAENPDSFAIGRIEHEADMLEAVNKHAIGPRLIFRGWGYIVYEFIEGVFLQWFLKHSPKEDIKEILLDIFMQLAKLDELNINKEEMHHPVKHIIVGKRNVLLDFERAHKAIKPQNITQFCDFLMSDDIYSILKEKGFLFEKEALIEKAREYRLKGEKAEPLPIINYVLEKDE